MKNIALMVPDFFIEHCQDFIRGVIQYCDGKDVKVFIGQTKLNQTYESLFDYQYWITTELLESDQIDAYIFISGVYCTTISQEEFFRLVGRYNNRPIISASIDLNMENCYSVISDSKKSYYQIIKHLKEVHNCKKIAFMSANSTKSSEAIERYENFKQALKDNGLEFNEDFVFDGHFTDFDAKFDLLANCPKKEDVKFDSIVCANDIMATGVLQAFDELGIRCPEDVKIFGFDNAIFASLAYPKFSTVNQDIIAQGELCAELALKVINGEKVPKITYTELPIMIRQSCGCMNLNTHTSMYMDINQQLLPEKRSFKEILNLYQDEMLEKRKFYSLLDSINDSNTLKQFFFNISNILNVMNIRSMAVCLYEEPVYYTKADEYEIPEKAEVYLYADKFTHNSVFKPGVVFNPKEKIFPFEQFDDYAANFIVYPIFSGEANYGYMVCSPLKDNFSSYTVNFMIVVSAISQSVEYTQSIKQTEKLKGENNLLQESNTTLQKESKTDELTGILNRRGFFELGQRLIDVIQELNVPGIVFFADMDNLKKINDTYGHQMGDKAIKLQAEVLKRAFRTNDIIGRISGDEFGIVANGMCIDSVEVMRTKIDDLCSIVSKENELPFTLSISFGATDLEPSSVLSKLLAEADHLLYQQKKIKKAKLNGNK